jgi:hypothetical protein
MITMTVDGAQCPVCRADMAIIASHMPLPPGPDLPFLKTVIRAHTIGPALRIVPRRKRANSKYRVPAMPNRMATYHAFLDRKLAQQRGEG